MVDHGVYLNETEFGRAGAVGRSKLSTSSDQEAGRAGPRELGLRTDRRVTLRRDGALLATRIGSQA